MQAWCSIWQWKHDRCSAGLVLPQLQELGPNYDYDANFLTTTQTEITKKCSYVPEHCKIDCTWKHLFSYHLRVETGFWARIPLEDRTCLCRAVTNTHLSMFYNRLKTSQTKGNLRFWHLSVYLHSEKIL